MRSWIKEKRTKYVRGTWEVPLAKLSSKRKLFKPRHGLVLTVTLFLNPVTVSSVTFSPRCHHHNGGFVVAIFVDLHRYTLSNRYRLWSEYCTTVGWYCSCVSNKTWPCLLERGTSWWVIKTGSISESWLLCCMSLWNLCWSLFQPIRSAVQTIICTYASYHCH